MDVMDWLQHTSAWIQKDRPDLYPMLNDAFEDLLGAYDQLASRNGSAFTHFGNFFLHKYVEDGVTEWSFTRKISTVVTYEEEPGQTQVYSHTRGSGTVSRGIDHLPDVDDDSFI